MFEGRLGQLDELVVQGLFELVVLLDGLVQDRAGHRAGLLEDVGQVDPVGLPALDGLVLIQALNVADGLLKSPEAELGEDLAHFLSNEHEEVDHVLGLALEAGTKLRVLGGNALRAGVLLAGAHHDAAFHDQGCGGEAEFLGTKQGGDDHVTTGLELAVALDDDAGAQAVQDQRLLGFGQADLPRGAGVLDGVERGCTRTAVVAGDKHHVGMALGHTCSDGADAELGNELDVDTCLRVGHLRIVDQLLQILDGVDVVVRRRRDESHARHRAAQPCDVVADLVAGQLPALARLGALRHLDLDLVGRGQVFGGDAEAPGCHLLDARAQRVAGLQGIVGLHHILAQHAGQRGAGPDGNALQILPVAHRILTALAGVGLATDAVHGHRQRGMCLGGDGTQRHRPRGVALDDLGGRFHLIQRDGPFGVEAELEESTQRHQSF